MKIKIIHTGDNHIGYRQYGIKTRMQDFKDGFSKVVDTAIQQKANLTVLAGDIFNAAKPAPEDIEFVKLEVERLKKHKCTVIGIEGTHDAGSGSLLRLTGIIDLNNNPLEYKGLTVAGVPTIRDPGQLRQALHDIANNVNPDILVLHEGVEEFFPYGASLKLDDFSDIFGESKLQYVLLGHIHVSELKTVPRKGGIINLTYCGSTECCEVSEAQDKSVNLLEIDPQKPGAAKISKLPLNTRKITKITIATDEELDDFVSLLREQNENPDLFYVDLNSKLIQKYALAAEIIKDKEIPVNLNTYRADTSVTLDLKTIKAWDRDSVMPRIDDTVQQTYDTESEEYQLIVALCSNPEQKESIINKYLEEKGINA